MILHMLRLMDEVQFCILGSEMHNNRHNNNKKKDDEYNKCIEFKNWIKKIKKWWEIYTRIRCLIHVKRIPTRPTKPIFDAIFILFGAFVRISGLLSSINYRELWLCQWFWILFNQVIFIESKNHFQFLIIINYYDQFFCCYVLFP